MCAPIEDAAPCVNGRCKKMSCCKICNNSTVRKNRTVQQTGAATFWEKGRKAHPVCREEFLHMKTLDYFSLVQYLNDKYGSVKGSYFANESMTTHNKSIKRSSEGLRIHHVGEYKYLGLSSTANALSAPPEWQEGKNLVYCNELEHLLMHRKIEIEFPVRFEKKMAMQGYFVHARPLLLACVHNIRQDQEYINIIIDQLHPVRELIIDIFFEKNCLFALDKIPPKQFMRMLLIRNASLSKV